MERIRVLCNRSKRMRHATQRQPPAMTLRDLATSSKSPQPARRNLARRVTGGPYTGDPNGMILPYSRTCYAFSVYIRRHHGGRPLLEDAQLPPCNGAGCLMHVRAERSRCNYPPVSTSGAPPGVSRPRGRPHSLPCTRFNPSVDGRGVRLVARDAGLAALTRERRSGSPSS